MNGAATVAALSARGGFDAFPEVWRRGQTRFSARASFRRMYCQYVSVRGLIPSSAANSAHERPLSRQRSTLVVEAAAADAAPPSRGAATSGAGLRLDRILQVCKVKDTT